jgi:hypothetical protein
MGYGSSAPQADLGALAGGGRSNSDGRDGDRNDPSSRSPVYLDAVRSPADSWAPASGAGAGRRRKSDVKAAAARGAASRSGGAAGNSGFRALAFGCVFSDSCPPTATNIASSSYHLPREDGNDWLTLLLALLTLFAAISLKENRTFRSMLAGLPFGRRRANSLSQIVREVDHDARKDA